MAQEKFFVKGGAASFYRRALLAGCEHHIAKEAASVYGTGSVLAVAGSGKMGAGKDTVLGAFAARYAPNAEHLSLASAIRGEVDVILGLVRLGGDSVAEISSLLSVPQEVARLASKMAEEALVANPVLTAYDRTPELRKLLQYWGGGVRRDDDPMYWINKALCKIAGALAFGHGVYLTDVRYEAEARSLQELGLWLVRVNISEQDQRARLLARDGELPSAEAFLHPGEVGLDGFSDFDVVVDNTGALRDVVAGLADALLVTKE